MKSKSQLLAPPFLVACLIGCGDDGVPGSVAELRAGPSSGGTVQTGTCSDLEADCSARCSGSFDNVECTGPLSGSFDNVTVPPGASCVLDGALLTGNLIVEEGAEATIGPDVFVCGDLQGPEAARVSAEGTRVCGNLQVTDGGTARLFEGVEILKNLDVAKSGELDLAATLVCADAQLVENDVVRVPAGAAVVIGQNCSSDENVLFDYSGLTVRGDNDGCVGVRE